MADIDNFANSWEVLDHGQVEDAIKAKAAQLEAAINAVVPSSGITQEMLATALRQTIANAVPNSRKINGVSLNRDITLGPENISVGNITLAQKLDDLGSAIEVAAQSGSITMEDVNEVLQAYQPRLIAGTGIAINNNEISVETGAVAAGVDLPVSGNDVFQALDGITAGQTVVINSDGANIIDDYSDSVLVATSARLVKELYLNLQQLRSDLANMAFTNGKPSWITVAKRQYDLSLASSGNDGLSEVYIVNGDTDVTELTTTATKVNEGAVKLRLVPTASTYAFTHIIVNGVDIAQTAVDAGKSDGSVYVTFILNADATISATAASGVTVSMGSSTNCSMNITSQAVDENFSRQITASNHYTLPSAITVKLNGDTALASETDYTYTRANDNKTATLEIDKSKFANATSIEVTCVANPVASCTVSWSKVDMIVKHGNDVLFDNGNLATPSVTVYADDLNYALTFEAATGKKFTTAPNISGTDLIGSNGVYTLTVQSVASNITVGAEVGNLQMYSVALPNIGNGVASVELKDINNNTIEPVGGVYSVPENSSIKAIITPSTFYGLSVDDTNSSMGNAQNDWYTENENSDDVLLVTIQNVTGNVVINVLAISNNIDYKGVRYANGTGNYKGRYILFGRYGTDSKNCPYLLSRFVDIEGINTIQFHCGSSANPDNEMIEFYTSEFSYISQSAYSDVDRTLSRDQNDIPSSAKYCRMVIKGENVPNAWIKTGETNESLEFAWQGDGNTITNAGDFQKFIMSKYSKLITTHLMQTDSDGIINNIYRVSGALDGASTSLTALLGTGGAAATWMRKLWLSNNSYTLRNACLSPVIELPTHGLTTGTRPINVAGGTLGGSTNQTAQLLCFSSSAVEPFMNVTEGFAISTSGETKNIPVSYTKCRLLFQRDAYDNGQVYVIDTYDQNNPVQLWPPVNNSQIEE